MKNQRKRPRHSGFTLIEVLLVLVILVVIGTIAATSLFGAQDKANINAARAQIDMFESAMDLYRLDMNAYPDKLEDLIEKPSNKAHADKWTEPYINKTKLPVDPWGNEYKYSQDGKHNSGKYDVWSMGPDGDDGSDDDIGNWEK